MKKYYLFLCLTVTLNGFSQDPEFTQFYANPLYLNPAFAGTNNCPRVNMNYRNQWPSISGSYVTSSVSYDQELKDVGGVGLLLTHDVAAKTIKTTNFSGIYSKEIPLNRVFSVRIGFQATFFQKSLDWNKLTFGDMIDPKRGFVHPTNDLPRGGKKSGIDFSGGVLGYSDHFYVGVAAHHVTEPNESLIESAGGSPLPIKYTIHAGTVKEVGESKYQEEVVKVSPNILYRRQGTFEQLNLGLYLTKGILWAGVWYRNQDSFIVLLGLQNKNFKIGYSYDVTMSKLTMATGGAHEISLGMNFVCKPKKPKFRTLICPSF